MGPLQQEHPSIRVFFNKILFWRSWQDVYGDYDAHDIDEPALVVFDILVFKLNEYFVELNKAKFKFLNQFSN